MRKRAARGRQCGEDIGERKSERADHLRGSREAARLSGDRRKSTWGINENPDFLDSPEKLYESAKSDLKHTYGHVPVARAILSLGYCCQEFDAALLLNSCARFLLGPTGTRTRVHLNFL